MNGIECAFFARVGSVTPIKTSQSGKAWCAAKVAIGSDDATQWVRVALFNGLAEQLAPTLAKGDRVYIEGNLKLDRWQNAEGQESSGLSVAAWKVEKVAASAIGRNRPSKPKVPPEGEHHVPASANSGHRQSAVRNWQAPSVAKSGFDNQLEDEIRFEGGEN